MKLSTITLLGLIAVAAPAAQAVGIVTLLDLGIGNLQAINSFDSSTPGASSPVSISGLPSTDRLLGIDFRPATGQLFGLSSGSALYTINTSTGAATIVGTGFSTLLTAASYGFDFNPMIDRLRIVGDNNQNIVGHPTTGAANVAMTTPVAYVSGDMNFGADPNVVHHAYTNNFAGTTATQLYAIDSTLDILVKQANNDGFLTTVGPLNVNVTDVGGFDIALDGTAYAAFTNTGGNATLYTIDLATGTATSLGLLSGSVSGIAVVPEPSSLALLGVCGLGLLVRRRRA